MCLWNWQDDYWLTKNWQNSYRYEENPSPIIEFNIIHYADFVTAFSFTATDAIENMFSAKNNEWRSLKDPRIF